MYREEGGRRSAEHRENEDEERGSGVIPGHRRDEEDGGQGSDSDREFLRALALIGGRERVLLVGELWERGPSRELLRCFVRELFGEGGGGGGSGGDGSGGFGLLFLLCRSESVRRGRPELRALLQDVRGRRLRGGVGGAPAALVGALVLGEEEEEDGELLPALLELLTSVFGEEQRIQAAVYRPGEPRTALELKRAACRALCAARESRAAEEEEDDARTPTILQCFPWRQRKRRKNHQVKAANHVSKGSTENLQEGIALTCPVLREPLSGACGKSNTSAAGQEVVQGGELDTEKPKEPL
ncbi:uncharacterized protein C2orf72 homolog isoform X2 [Microcaecilia unicolor]|uniref:Uncharacterized protein C2orf72 homolog isoform X2 n=1 Tax=Microcaecilia unicolor TaxID=1415580 RepID=A0A6P7YXA0_9AMPH|nr:uncharacterized protein C2orf72 homolog isoform X2 [Microcaecilia unicolor]